MAISVRTQAVIFVVLVAAMRAGTYVYSRRQVAALEDRGELSVPVGSLEAAQAANPHLSIEDDVSRRPYV